MWAHRGFAAIAPICGGGNSDKAARISHVPAWVFHGAKDSTVQLSKSEEMVDALKEAGGNVKFTVYPDANHDSWTETYNNPEQIIILPFTRIVFDIFSNSVEIPFVPYYMIIKTRLPFK
jgi:predicted peptidase